MTWLLDGNVLVALVVESHVHHDRAHHWFGALRPDRFATCILTQGTLLRVHMRSAADRSAAAAWRALKAVAKHPQHDWWDDRLDFLDVPHRHLQVPPAFIVGITADRVLHGQLGVRTAVVAVVHHLEG